MPQPFDPATREALLARVRFYRDLGLTEFYRRPVDPALLERLEAQSAPPVEGAASQHVSRAPSFPLPSAESVENYALEPSSVRGLTSQEGHTIAPRKPFPASPELTAAVPAADRAFALHIIREDIGDCTRCALHKGRNKIVFGDGSPTARLMFVGEGPGADEDAQGVPFVGKAGQLLNNMIAAMGLKREEVYIANVVKCRPPGNRTPEPDEANTCTPFLFRQIDVVRPQVLVALGATAATYLLGARQPLAGLRGRVHAFRGMQLIVTYHPAYLLRDPRQKKEAWADLQIAMRELGLKPPARG
ncbi:MAG: uracil-DNA glycosylase [Terracidiphilus sp.]